METKQGFTLIELLVVVLIIGILSAVAFPQYQKAVAKSKATELFVNLKTIVQAAESVYLDTGTYPTDFTLLPISLPGEIRDYGDNKNYILTTPSGNEYWLETGLSQISGVLSTKPRSIFQLNYFIKGPNKGKIRCQADKNNTFANELCKSLGGSYSSEIGGNKMYWL